MLKECFEVFIGIVAVCSVVIIPLVLQIYLASISLLFLLLLPITIAVPLVSFYYINEEYKKQKRKEKC